MKDFLDDEMRIQNIDAEYEKNKEELIMYEDAKEMNFRDKVHAKTGATPLHVSAAKGYSRVLKLLIQYGANVNALDKDGWTPLHAAAHWEQEEACRILSENGANFDIKNYSLQTPYEVCDEEMVAKLRLLQRNSTKNNSNTNSLQKEKLNDVTSLNNRLSRQLSGGSNITDEFSKSSIKALAQMGEKDGKKQPDKILLSPIITTTNDSDLLAKSDSHEQNSVGSDDRLNSDKENVNRASLGNMSSVNSLSSGVTISSNTMNTSANNGSLNQLNATSSSDEHARQQQPPLFAKSNSLNKVSARSPHNLNQH